MFLVLTFTLFARLVSGIESCSFSIPTIHILPLVKIELNTTENGGKTKKFVQRVPAILGEKGQFTLHTLPNPVVISSKVLSLCNIADSGYHCCVHAVGREIHDSPV